MNTRILAGAASAAVLLASTLYVLAAAADRNFAYHGRLELNGVPAQGTYNFSFAFFDVPTAGVPLGSVVTRNGVSVSAGEFSVELPIPDAALNASAVYLAVSVAPQGGSSVVLPQRQRIFATPFAMRGRHDGNFVVDGMAEVRGSLTATGNVSATGAVAAAAGTVIMGENAGGSGTRSLSFSREPGDEQNAGKIVYRAFGDNLSVIGAGANGVRKIKLWDDVEVNGNLTVNGTASLQATAWCDCERENELVTTAGVIITASVPYQEMWEANQPVGGGINQCRGGRFLVGLEKTNSACINSLGCIEQYKCCRPCSLRSQ